MTLPQFILFLDTAEQISAKERSSFIVDMSTVVSGAFAAKGKNPIQTHLDLLGSVASGESSGNDQ